MTIFLWLPGMAQEKLLRGSVTDVQNMPLPGAAIQLKGKEVGTVTDMEGRFSLSLAKGDVMMVSFLGFQLREITYAGEEEMNIVLEEAATDLDEVVVSFKEPLIETQKGTTTFRVDKLATNSGVSAMEVLKKLPGVSLNQNGQILWRGSAGINVMVDGKRSFLTGNQLAIYLEGFNADEIEKIELIKNPSAAYEAEGNAGLINIVTKGQKPKGYAIGLRSNVSKGRYWRTNQGISASLNKGKWSIYGSFDYNTPHRYRSSQSGNTITENGQQVSLERNNEVPFRINYYTWKMGGDWQLAPNHRMGIDYHGYFDDFRGTKTSTIRKNSPTDKLLSTVHSVYELQEPYHYDAIGWDYQFDMDEKGRKLTADARYISYRNYSDGLMESDHLDSEGNLIETNILRMHQPGFIKIFSTRVDLDLPIAEWDIKAGLKYGQAENDNNFRFEELSDGTFVMIPESTNHYRYHETISAGYLSALRTFQDLEVRGGLRLEYTKAQSSLMEGDFDKKWEYIKLFPSLSFTYTVNDKHNVDLAVSRRINRPSYSSLNPVRWYNDEYFYYYGNPSLVPEMGWLFNFSWTFPKDFVASVDYSQRNQYISRKLSYDSNGVTVRSQSANFSHFDRWDFTLTAPITVNDYWDIQAYAGVNHTRYPIEEASQERKLSRWATTFSLQQQLTFLEHYSFDMTISYTSPELQGMYLTKNLFFTDIGIKRSFMEEKLEAVLTLTDVFNSYRLYGQSQSTLIDYHYMDKPDSRRLGLTVSYRIGGKLFKEKARKSEEEERL
ncbi:outer membrane beta-barrel family protein [Echinicola rosea]|nr:outer membrane beta-barrel family protein [Echinicola rosea]